jgi:hypothetical protein
MAEHLEDADYEDEEDLDDDEDGGVDGLLGLKDV